ncbi:hypothetical protein mRhiFer1_008920 [Rhinolophus ferrumequinum]|uniref:Uncharacterized protein n=1 Tax=Rhinolophus ferrumequinum TaxID=59479 RepID=A0A7J7TDW1_RHIFE|nr:hypothetical protein mRhiFer1_008920 [Rhinolophus ferrumequinum]
MPGRGVGPSRSGRGVRRPGGKRWGVGTSRGRGSSRRVRSSVWETRCVSAERLQDGRQRRRAAETVEAEGANEASETPGPAGSIEAARDPGAVLVNGDVGEPQVVGPAGSVWATGIGEEEEEAFCRSPRGCERKGRPGSMGHESILELWLKVQAMRAASGCGEGSRVELHPVPAGEGPVERGIPGRASWIETSRGGLTGPWVKGQARTVPQASGISAATDVGPNCERPSSSCGQGQAGRVPPVGVLGTVETRSGIAPHLLGRGLAEGVPGAVEEIGYGAAPGPWPKAPTMGVPGAMVWPEAVEVPRAVEGGRGYGGAPGLWERGLSVQVPGALAQEAVCGDTLGVWGRAQAMGVSRVVEEETPGLWRRRQALEDVGPRGIPGLWGTGQPVGVPCSEEETRRGGDPGFSERGQAVWVETGSGGDRGSWEAAQTAEVSSPDEQKAGPEVAPGLWGVGQAMGVPRALGKETGCANVPGVWGAEQPVGLSQAGVVLGAMGEHGRYGGIPGLWDRQQAMGVPLADAVPGVVGEETCCGNVLSLWERRQAMGEQEAVVPTALGVCGSVDQETGYEDISCLCRRRQAMGLPETVGVSEASGMPKHRCAPATGLPAAMDVPGSGRVPAAVWVSGPMCPESSSSDVLNLWERVQTARIPVASGVPVSTEELWPVREDGDSAAFPGSWGRRQGIEVPMTDRVSVAPEVPGLVGEETGSGGVTRSWRRRQSARVPVAAEVSTTSRVPGPLGVETGSGVFSHLPGRRQAPGVPVTAGVPVAPRPVWEETGSGGVSGLWGETETVQVFADANGPTRRVMPATARMPGPKREKMGPGGISGLSGGKQTAGVPMAVGLCTATGVPGPEGDETLSGSLLGLSDRGQTAEMPVAARIAMAVGAPTAAGVPVPMVGDPNSGDVPGVWGRRPAAEGPPASRAPGPVDRETGSEGVSGMWRRRPDGVVPEAVRVPLSLGVLAAVGVPMAGRVPAAVWVTGSTGEEANAAVSGLTVVRRPSTEGPGASEQETGGRSVLGLARRNLAPGLSYTCGRGDRLWSCPRSVGEETDYQNVPGFSGTGTAAGANGAVEVPPVSREETGLEHFRGHLQQSSRRQTGGVSGIRVRGNNLGENCVEGDRMRGAFQ